MKPRDRTAEVPCLMAWTALLVKPEDRTARQCRIYFYGIYCGTWTHAMIMKQRPSNTEPNSHGSELTCIMFKWEHDCPSASIHNHCRHLAQGINLHLKFMSASLTSVVISDALFSPFNFHILYTFFAIKIIDVLRSLVYLTQNIHNVVRWLIYLTQNKLLVVIFLLLIT